MSNLYTDHFVELMKWSKLGSWVTSLEIEHKPIGSMGLVYLPTNLP